MLTLGIDIGGTKTAVGLFDGGERVQEGVVPTSGFEQTFDSVNSLVQSWNPGIIAALGIACAGPLDTIKGIVLNEGTLPSWLGKPIKSTAERLFSAPSILLNDADAALLGEVFAGDNNLLEGDSVVMLTFGTGVGGAFWDGRRVFQGAFGEHPEIGHIGLDPSGPLCYCGLRGCLESLTSGTALDGFAKGLGLPGVDRLAELAVSGEERANDLLELTKVRITLALVTLTHAYRPTAFVLGGGVMEKLGMYLLPESVPVNSTTVIFDSPKILLASLGNRAGMVGASVATRKLL